MSGSGLLEDGGWLPEFVGQREPFRPGNQVALKHGANSERQINAKARAHKRRFLRQIGLKATDLDPLAREYLGLWARGKAQLDLREAGGVDAGKDYWTAYNGTRRALEKLERRLAQVGLDRGRGGDGIEALIRDLRAVEGGR